jgi:hypothetical protein
MNKLQLFPAAALAVALAGCAESPHTYEEIVALPPDAQLVAFKACSPVEKAAVYRGHMLHVAARPGLTEAQRAAVMRAADEVEAADYGPHSQADWDARTGPESYVGAIRAAFGDDARLVLYSLD